MECAQQKENNKKTSVAEVKKHILGHAEEKHEDNKKNPPILGPLDQIK